MKLKPVVIDDYTQHMLGVDKLDQFASYYSFLHKGVKWCRMVFFWMLKVAVINAYTIYKKLAMAQRQRPVTHKAFFEHLLTTYQSHPKVKHPSKLDDSNQPLRTLNVCSRYLTSQRRGESADCCVCSDRRPGGKRHSDTTTVPHAASSLLCV